jgi:hypothetical protein
MSSALYASSLLFLARFNEVKRCEAAPGFFKIQAFGGMEKRASRDPWNIGTMSTKNSLQTTP